MRCSSARLVPAGDPAFQVGLNFVGEPSDPSAALGHMDGRWERTPLDGLVKLGAAKSDKLDDVVLSEKLRESGPRRGMTCSVIHSGKSWIAQASALRAA
jgi:hypothetical protein